MFSGKNKSKEKTRPEYDFHEYLIQLGSYKDLHITIPTVQGYSDRKSKEVFFKGACCSMAMDVVIKNSVFSGLPEKVVQYDLEKEKKHWSAFMKRMFKDKSTIDEYEAVRDLKTRHAVEAALRKEILCKAIIEAEGLLISEEEYQQYMTETFKGRFSESDVRLDTQRRQSYLERKIIDVLWEKNEYIEKTTSVEALLGAMKKKLPIPNYLQNYLVLTSDENSEYEVTGKIRCNQCQGEEFIIMEAVDFNCIFAICSKCGETIILYDQYEHGWNGFICHSEEDEERKTDFEGWICAVCDSKGFKITVQVNSQGREFFITNCLCYDQKEQYKPDDWVDAFDSICIMLECAGCGAEFDELCYEAS